jgi:hypothetical protein
MPLFALGALLLAQAASPLPATIPTAAPRNIPLGPQMAVTYRCTTGGTVKLGLTAHAATLLYDGRAFVFARTDEPDGSILLVGSGRLWTVRGGALTLSRGVGARSTIIERCTAVGPG